MSLAHTALYRLEQERMRQEWARRRQEAIRDTLRVSLDNCIEIYNRMLREGVNKYVSLNSVQNSINSIENILNYDPDTAYTMSNNLHSSLRDLEITANNLKREEQRREEERRKEEERRIKEEYRKNKELVEEYYYSFIRELEDPYIISFAKSDLEALRDEFFSLNEISNDALSRIEKDFKSKMQKVLDNSKEAYEAHKLKKEKEVEKTLLTEKLSNISSELSKMNTDSKEALEKKDKLLKEIEKTKSFLSDNIDIDKIKKEIETLDNESTDLLISEETRREVVKSIIRTLKSNDFKVEHPELIADENGGVVRIIAKKPSGKRSVCEVGLDGKLKYLFDNYEGLTCVNDIEKFEADLENIYSIKLSNKIQTWENPDRISKNAIDINNTDKRTL